MCPTDGRYNALVYRPNPARNIHLANNDYAWTGDQEVCGTASLSGAILAARSQWCDPSGAIPALQVPCCWAEQSLKPAERALHRAWGLPRPGWLNATYWDLLIAD